MLWALDLNARENRHDMANRRIIDLFRGPFDPNF